MTEFAAPASDAELLRRIGQIAEQAGLGAHRSAYPAAPANWGAVRTAFFLMLGGVTLTAIGVAANLEWLQGLAGFFSVVMIGTVLIGVVRTWRYDRKVGGSRLDLFEHGMVTAQPGGVVAFRYETAEVLQRITEHYRNGVFQGTTYHYTFAGPDGARAVVNEAVANVLTWGPEIQQAVTTAQLPRVAARVRAGERVAFGDLWISATEVGSGRKSVGWDRAEQLVVVSGSASIGVDGKFFGLSTTPISRIPNFFVFQALFEHLRSSHGRISAVD
ncbi:DUF6585 family protein [Nocardia sp. NPDC056100]|uniref:DUF6585 family protein n=1 Tax=Nocardia sp. NPDC056100 TaxID=3345712 RepID=UPI0035DDD14D